MTLLVGSSLAAEHHSVVASCLASPAIACLVLLSRFDHLCLFIDTIRLIPFRKKKLVSAGITALSFFASSIVENIDFAVLCAFALSSLVVAAVAFRPGRATQRFFY